MNDWYHIHNVDSVDSPALVVYEERVKENIQLLTKMIDDVSRLRPHVKTHKCREAAMLQLQAGITKFKCATIAEAEMLGMVEAPDVLLAYQLAGPKIQRFILTIKQYPGTRFSCLVDNISSASELSTIALQYGMQVGVYIDLNLGMNRTGLAPGQGAIELFEQCATLPGIHVHGFHAYDGHINMVDLEERTRKCNGAFEPVELMHKQLLTKGYNDITIIAGGSPTFPIHAKRAKVECSPGTFVYWDNGYKQKCPEQPFIIAALLVCRVISLPAANVLCIDLGHKSVASENELSKRVTFLNAPDLEFIGHSEEHLIATAHANHQYKCGDVLYGLPYHICPTVALYERALVVEQNEVKKEWLTIARDRRISI